MSTDTPLALKLAQMLDDTHQHPVIAAELRRLHEENEALRHDLKTEAVLSFRKQVEWMESKQEKDTALLRQALEALDYHCTSKPGHEQPIYELWEALRERLGEKT